MLNSVVTWLMKKRRHQRELFLRYPNDVQKDVLGNLLQAAERTEFGKTYDFHSIRGADDFRQRIPLQDYDSLKPLIDRHRKGENNVIWPSTIKWFAKSSGTTNTRSKFIPVSTEALEECHFKGGKDMLGMYCQNHPDTKIFSGKGLSIGGSHQVDSEQPNVFQGDLSAVLLQNLPLWTELFRTPKLEVALMDDWEAKMAEMIRITKGQNITNIQGVPSWTLVLLQRILTETGKTSISEVWPNLEVFFHGAVSFVPYRAQFKQVIGGSGINYMETYNASEGFFAIQDRPDSDDMLLMLDYGIYYEFIPMEQWHRDQPESLLLHEVEVGKQYALIISTNAGLWRYAIGDTVTFTSTDPFRIRVTGRTKHFINAFGEELIIENAEKAIRAACIGTNSEITDYTAAPLFISDKTNGRHEWLIEFATPPPRIEHFAKLLDNTLRELNSDYDAKRKGDMVLSAPLVRSIPSGTFYNWMASRGKLGGQHKVPRLSNDRTHVEDILDNLKNLQR